jgi:hypothetical protein
VQRKTGESQLTCHFFSRNTGIKTIMLLIIFLVLIAKLAFVSGDCDHRPSDVNDLDLAKADISVLTRFLKQAAFITAGCIYILLVIPLKNFQLTI